MAFVVEDGSGKTDATSYVSEAEADTYFSEKGSATFNTTWTALDSTGKQNLLTRATAYIERTYQGRWSEGRKKTKEQALDWPRDGAYYPDGWYVEEDEIPQDIKDAVCEVAVRLNSDELDADLGRITTSERVGPVSVSYQPGSDRTTYPAIDAILRPWVYAGVVGRTVRG
jgi:hypothetical protein